MKKQVIRLGLSMVLATAFLASCSKDNGREPEISPSPKDSITVTLSAEAGVDADALRAWEHELSLKNGNFLPTRTLVDGDKVDVHTAIQCPRLGIYAIKTLKWTYKADRNILRLEGEDASIDLYADEDAFTNDNEWYLTGIIGGTLIPYGRQDVVYIKQPRVLKGYNASSTDRTLDLDIPYLLSKTRLTISESVGKPMLTPGEQPKFSPMGCIVGSR